MADRAVDLRERLFGIDDERAIVTGAGSGIGRAVALTLVDMGLTVFGMGRRAERLGATAQEASDGPGSFVPVVCDIRDPNTVEAAFAEVELEGGPATALVHCAASAFPSMAEQLTPAGFRAVVSSSLEGAFFVLSRWGRALIASGQPGAAVALTSALAGRETPGLAHSCAAKGGVESMVRTLAAEWGRYGLRLNAVGPGTFPTEGTNHVWERDSVSQRMLSRIPLGRFGTTEEVVGPIVFLLSRSAQYTTGDVLVVDGGLRLADWTLIAPGDESYERVQP